MLGFSCQQLPKMEGISIYTSLKCILDLRVHHGWLRVRNIHAVHRGLTLSNHAGGTFSSVRLGDTSSPSRVVRSWMNNTRIFASMMWDRRRSPTRNMKHSLPSRRHTTALLLNCSVRVRCFGRTIFRKISPTCETYSEVTVPMARGTLYCHNYWFTATNFKIQSLTSRWCCWRFRSSGLWRGVVGSEVMDVLTNHSTVIFKTPYIFLLFFFLSLCMIFEMRATLETFTWHCT